MPLRRCSEQKRQTIEEFYAEFIPEKNQFWADAGTSMLKVTKLINDTFKDTVIYGLTSYASLNFLIQDDSQSDWLVTINSSGDEFYIEYLMTKNNRPWPNARVKGSTKSLDEFKILIVIAMTESQGWNESSELKALYDSIKPG